MYFTTHYSGFPSPVIFEIEIENEFPSIIENNEKCNGLHSKKDKKMTKDTRDQMKV